MALQYSPKIVQDSLVMCLDPSQNKSYPTTDLPVKDRLNLWLDAADDTTFSYSSGTTVSQWRDKSGQNNHAVVMGGSPLRSVAINSRKAVSFTSTTSFKCVAGAFISTATHIVVCRATTSSATYQRVYNGGANSDYRVFIGGHANNIATFWGSGPSVWFDTSANSPSTTLLNTLRIISAVNNGTTATPYYDGTSMSTKTTTNSAAYTGYELNTYGNGVTNQTLTGEVCEIIVFNKQLSTTELKQVHTYLGQKWGISNTDRQIFDLSGNNFNFAFNGANPRYNAKTIVSNFDTTSPFAVSSFGGQNLTSNILNLLYADHTIEVAFNAKGFQSIYNYDNSLTTQNGQSIVIWTGRHSGLRVAQNQIIYEYWNSQSTNVGISVSISSYVDKIIYITATRTGDVLRLYINGVLASGPTTVAATTSPVSYSQINIGAAYQGNPTTQGYIWAGQHEYHLLRMYTRRLSDVEVASNYQAFKARFDNNIVRFGLVMELDAGNPTSYAGSGTTWYDVSGNNNNGTLTLGPTYNSDSGGVIVFDGVDDYVVLNGGSAINNWNPDGTNAGTSYRSYTSANIWFKAATVNTSGASKMIFSDNFGVEYGFYQINNTLYGSAIGTSSTTISANVWYNACIVGDVGRPTTGTYSQSGTTTVTITTTYPVTFSTGATVYVAFAKTGGPDAVPTNNNYVVTVTGANTFTITSGVSATSNGTIIYYSSTNQSTVTFYLNGSLIGTNTANTGNGGNDTPFNLGRDNGVAGTNWNGSIALFQLYNKALTAAEVLQNYNATKGRFGL